MRYKNMIMLIYNTIEIGEVKTEYKLFTKDLIYITIK